MLSNHLWLFTSSTPRNPTIKMVRHRPQQRFHFTLWR